MFEQRNGKWRVLDRLTSWESEGPRITNELLDRFKDIAIKVLSEKNPELELEPEERFVASLYEKERLYSSQLRKGIADTLALLGSKPEALTTCSHNAPESIADSVVMEILHNAGWDLWSSLNDVLPLLAEASPTMFINAVDRAKSETFIEVFNQETPGITGRTYMSGLLWALETLAWHPDYLVLVCRILGDLAAIDPGGNWGNRPDGSLTTILLPWLPQTCASNETRHAAVKIVVKEQPEVGWKLILSLLPTVSSASSGTSKPTWRTFISDTWKNDVSEQQYWEDILLYSELALELAGSDAVRLEKLVTYYFRLPLKFRRSFRQRLTSTEVLDLPEKERLQLWTTLNRWTGNHRKYAGHDNWTVPEPALEELENIADKLKPVSSEIRHKRLFEGKDFDLYDEVGDWKEKKSRLEQRRLDAVSEILATGGLSSLLNFADQVETPWLVGLSSGMLNSVIRDSDLLPKLLKDVSKSLDEFIRGYIWGRFQKKGWKWVEQIFDQNWSVSIKSQFLACLPFNEETWDHVETYLGKNEKSYWVKAIVNPLGYPDISEKTLTKLIQYGRADDAIQCIYYTRDENRRKISNHLIITALNELKSNQEIDSYAIGELITHLQKDTSVEVEQLLSIEWKFLGILGRHNRGTPQTLSIRLAEDPNFFCEVIQTVFRSKKVNVEDEEEKPTEKKVENARNAYHLLYEWQRPPGTKRDNSFDDDALKVWVNKVREICTESGHWEVAANKIGEVLYYAPKKKSGLWVESVCEILDEKGHERIRSGLKTQIINTRGVHSYTGGNEENALADKWAALANKADINTYSRLAQSLRQISEMYRNDAKREANENPFEDF